MNSRVIKALLKKDSRLFLNNRFYLLITVVGIIFYIGAYFVLPAHSNETLKNSTCTPLRSPRLFRSLLIIKELISNYLLIKHLCNKLFWMENFKLGLLCRQTSWKDGPRGEKPQITFYYSAATPVETKQAVISLIEELSYRPDRPITKFQYHSGNSGH